MMKIKKKNQCIEKRVKENMNCRSHELVHQKGTNLFWRLPVGMLLRVGQGVLHAASLPNAVWVHGFGDPGDQCGDPKSKPYRRPCELGTSHGSSSGHRARAQRRLARGAGGVVLSTSYNSDVWGN